MNASTATKCQAHSVVVGSTTHYVESFGLGGTEEEVCVVPVTRRLWESDVIEAIRAQNPALVVESADMGWEGACPCTRVMYVSDYAWTGVIEASYRTAVEGAARELRSSSLRVVEYAEGELAGDYGTLAVVAF